VGGRGPGAPDGKTLKWKRKKRKFRDSDLKIRPGNRRLRSKKREGVENQKQSHRSWRGLGEGKFT